MCRSQFFDENAAKAICSILGYDGLDKKDAVGWGTGHSNKWFAEQSKYNITLGEIKCEDMYWSTCLFSISRTACSHYSDIFLRCVLTERLPSTGRKRKYTVIDTMVKLK